MFLSFLLSSWRYKGYLILPKEIHSRLIRGLSAPPSSPTNSQDLPQAFPFSCCQAKSLLRFPVKWWRCLELSFTAHADKQWGSEMLTHVYTHRCVCAHTNRCRCSLGCCIHMHRLRLGLIAVHIHSGLCSVCSLQSVFS